MKLDYLAKPFTLDIHVDTSDVDGLGHVNNAVYVTWMERCAWAHSEALGIGLDVYQSVDRAMAVHRHEIDYLAPTHAGEALTLATWIVTTDHRLRMDRHFQLVRPADEATLLRAVTTFVCIEMSSGRPKRMPELFLERYGQALIQG